MVYCLQKVGYLIKLFDVIKLPNEIHWNLFIRGFIIRWFQIEDGSKVDPKCIVSNKQKCIDCIEKWP